MPDDKPKSNRGGKRAGAGRKPKGYVSPSKLGDIDLRAVLEGDIPEQIESEAQRHALVVVGELVKIITHGESDANRVSACNAILDRGYGKPSTDTGVDMLPFLGKAPPKTSLSEIRTAARRYARLAIEALHKIATSSESEAARVSAARSLLDRGLGTAAVARLTAKDRADTAPPPPRETSWASLVGSH